LSQAWNALADPTRREILQLLRKGDMNAGDIAAKFDMTKPSISHHLNILKQAELVKAKKAGQNMIYSLNTSVLEDMMAMIAGLMEEK